MRGASSDRRSVVSRASRHVPTIQVPMVGQPYDMPLTYNVPMVTTGTLRSSRSVPALAYETGCPVHGGVGGVQYPVTYDMPLRRFGSMVDMRSVAGIPPPHPVMVGYGHEKKMMAPGYAMTLARPAFYPPPPRPMMMSAFQDPFKVIPMPGKLKPRPVQYDDGACCRGHLVVLWIILIVVTIGVIAGECTRSKVVAACVTCRLIAQLTSIGIILSVTMN